MERLTGPRTISFSYASRQGLGIFSECFYQNSFRFIMVLSELLPYDTSRPRCSISLRGSTALSLERQMNSRVLYVTDSASIFFQGLWACQSLGRATWSCRPHPGVSVSHWILQGQTRQLSALSSAWELSVAN